MSPCGTNHKGERDKTPTECKYMELVVAGASVAVAEGEDADEVVDGAGCDINRFGPAGWLSRAYLYKRTLILS